MLRKWFYWLTLAGLSAGAGTGAALVALFRLPLTATIVTGAAVGSGLVALSVLRQIHRFRRPWSHRVLIGAGLLTAGLGLLTARGSWPSRDLLWTILAPIGSLPALVAVVSAAATLSWWTDQRLGRLGRASLSEGAHVAAAAATAGNFLDLSLLTGVLEVHRWRRVGRVTSGAFPLGRWRSLARADLRRLFRTPGALPLWSGLALVPYAAAGLAPTWAPLAQLLAACAATSRLAAGLRTINRSPALRRALGGSDSGLRAVHLTVPSSGALVWCLGTAPATWQSGPWLWFVAAVGAVAVTYRLATRPPRTTT